MPFMSLYHTVTCRAGDARIPAMVLYDWATMPVEELNPQIARRAIHTASMTIARLFLKKGAVVPEHSHVNEQVAFVERGALKFFLEGGEHVIRAGQTLVIPSGVPHKVEVLEDSEVTDTFSPVREDWLRGDDAYLRR